MDAQYIIVGDELHNIKDKQEINILLEMIKRLDERNLRLIELLGKTLNDK